MKRHGTQLECQPHDHQHHPDADHGNGRVLPGGQELAEEEDHGGLGEPVLLELRKQPALNMTAAAHA